MAPSVLQHYQDELDAADGYLREMERQLFALRDAERARNAGARGKSRAAQEGE